MFVQVIQISLSRHISGLLFTTSLLWYYLFSDDLRPELGAYGRTEMHTPHFDALAKRSMLFDHAYVQVVAYVPHG